MLYVFVSLIPEGKCQGTYKAPVYKECKEKSKAFGANKVHYAANVCSVLYIIYFRNFCILLFWCAFA